MFKIQQYQEGDHQYLVIRNTNNDTLATLCLTLGGSLHQLKWDGNWVVNNLQQEGDSIQFTNSSCGAILFPFVNRIDEGSYAYENVPYQLYCNEKKYNNAIHGLVYKETFELTSSEVDNHGANVVLKHQHYLSEGFPFPFDIELHYEMTTTSLSLKVLVTNTGNNAFPFSIGWHPYFWADRLEESCLILPTSQRVLVNERMIPTELENFELDNPCWLTANKTFDTAFEQQNNITEFHTPDYSITLESKTPQEKYYTQIYTPDHRNSVAIEPMTAIANCFNNDIGTQELLPQKMYSIHWEISYSASEEV